MSDRLETVLREAQRVRAAQAPDPDRIRRALPVLAARRARRRRAGLVAGAALGVAVVVVAALLVPGRRTTPLPEHRPDSSPPVAASAPAPVVLPQVTESYAPGWVPSGFRERSRGAVFDTNGVRVGRTWRKLPFGPGGRPAVSDPFLRVVSVPEQRYDGGTPIEVGGINGWYVGPQPGNRTALVGWSPAPGRTVIVDSNAVLDRADLLHVAESVRLDTATVLRPPLALTWSPATVGVVSYEYGGDSPAAWFASVDLENPVDIAGSLSVTVAPGTDAVDGGETVHVHGILGRFVVDESTTDRNPRECAVAPVEAAGDRRLTVCGPILGPGGPRMAKDDLLRAAETVDPAMRADTAWLG
ncbi:hypothetical protein ACPPVO_19340 [Dactylosporangium sp. McL0621]|uniref:hypothetical protein n=1 Tax=Dactylosporangium sp. McL0621 TaxID=3415678 RepID=UPI003CFABF3B